MNSSGYIITGGPGSGKSTLLEAMRDAGYCCFSEVSRQLIRQQSLLADGVLPWNNLPAFARLAFDAMMRQHDQAIDHDGICFFDRGIPDVFGYLEEGGHPVPACYIDAHERCRYEKNVIVLPPWKEIFTNDSERPQSFQQSVRLYRSICSVYERLGYTLHELPKSSVNERVRYLLKHFTELQAPARQQFYLH
ncbi:AAA family ATPase [Chlorobium phaeobacteroides]|uniref:NadR/Ttd14 AAA domain-containing protein n=1 Tax=Chlorobium phaeobacteroides (strain DSM 266 / SMG 266 / 2430) TaxID=290317 RepID=A1BD98_CHLPD|nr:AAA family ATPase [Chlorobium phaeobacteroides]ABL64375.1 conserved hypothetical protein [Chlorobium phaeobacteroides DSM 266]MBV5320005.1 AAA family ATPase [Chlorobium phaeobacteroides]